MFTVSTASNCFDCTLGIRHSYCLGEIDSKCCISLCVTAERYCRLLKSEGGLELLDTVQADPRTLDAVRKLAQTVRDQVSTGHQKENPLQDISEQCQIDENLDD